MLRLLIAAAVLLGAAYFYLNSGGGNARPLETQQRAIEQAKQVEKTVQDQAEKMRKQIEEQSGGSADNDDGQH